MLDTPLRPHLSSKWVQKFSTLWVMRYKVMCRFCSGVESCIQFYLWNHFEGKIYEGRYVWCWNLFSNSKNTRTIPWCVFYHFLFSWLLIKLDYNFWNRGSMIPSPLCWGEPPIRHCTPQFTMTIFPFVYYSGQYHYHSESWHISKKLTQNHDSRPD